MNNVKTIVVATILLSASMVSNQEYSAYTKEPVEIEDIITEPISSEISTEEQTVSTETAEEKTPSATAAWDNHLDALKEKDQYWNKNSNIPTNDWKEKAIELAKEALDKDRTVADALKSAFFNVMTEKIKIEEGEFTAGTYALIKEFDDAIDAYVTKLKDAEAAQQEAQKKEEEKVEPVVESTPTPAETETPPAPPVEEPKATQPETTTPPAPATRDISQEWQDHLEKIATTGNSDTEQRNLLSKTYDLAKELLSEGYTDESIFYGFESAIFRHNANPKLLHIRIDQAIEALSAETGIQIPYNEQVQTQQYMNEMKKQAEQDIAKKQKEAATTVALLEKISVAPGPKTSEMQEWVARLKEDLVTQHASDQAEMNARLEQMKRELIALRKTKEEKTPEQAQGIFGRAVGAVKNVAAAASNWWYGGESQEQKDLEVLDKERFKKLQELLNAMTLTHNEKLVIEKNWNIFIEQLRSFKDLDINNAAATNTWLMTIQQALEHLTIAHHIISIKDAINIIKDSIKQYPNSTKFTNDIKKYLEDKQRKIIEIKQQKETALQKKAQEKEKLKQLEEHQIKNKKEHKQTKQNIIDAYEREKTEWQKFLMDIAQHKTATEQDNITYTNEAIKKAESLLNPAKPVVLKNKHLLGQQLKEQFTVTFLNQQKSNEHPINIYKNIDQFNNAINRLTD